jgi:hypothetical protein
MRRCISGGLLAAGCHSGEGVPQLEAIEVSGIEGGISARFAVSGSDRDYWLTSDDGAVEIAVHTPTGADLTALDGASLTFEGGGDIASVATWRASDGAPRWLAYRSEGELDPAVDEWFGTGFADLGEVQGEERIGSEGVNRRYHEAVFQTDDGPVALIPGQVDTLVVGGVQWRVGVVAAFLDYPLSNVRCAYFPTLSYELLRVDAPVEPETVAPMPDLPIPPSRGCGG